MTYAGKYDSLENAVKATEQFDSIIWFAIYKYDGIQFYDCSKIKASVYELEKQIKGKKAVGSLYPITPFSAIRYAVNFTEFDNCWFFKSLR
jgi:hypothetical protein